MKTALTRIDTLVVPDVLFAVNDFRLNKAAVGLLDSLLQRMPKVALDSVGVSGHTDSTGRVGDNAVLSRNRAQTVASFLREKIGLEPVGYEGRGSEMPVGDNRTPDGRRKNRRVEIYFFLRD